MVRDEIERRLRRLEDERAVLRNLNAYGQSIDYGEEERWVDCFTEDGVFVLRNQATPEHDAVVSGREELRAFISRHTRIPELWHKHMLVEPLVEVSGGTATCVSYLFALQDFEDVPVVRAFGRYRDRLVRGRDGRFRFHERIVEVESRCVSLPPFVGGRPGLLQA